MACCRASVHSSCFAKLATLRGIRRACCGCFAPLSPADLERGEALMRSKGARRRALDEALAAAIDSAACGGSGDNGGAAVGGVGGGGDTAAAAAGAPHR
jgi:hypothetical protein